MVFTQAELDYLATQRIGRLATVSPDGQSPHQDRLMVAGRAASEPYGMTPPAVPILLASV
ncbi:UNVERIFIED_ORG: hypothetical protein FHR35_001159 [Microbispora rosea subsp. rosea]